MPLRFINSDITKITGVEVLVNSANPDPQVIGAGVEDAVFEAAGPGILDARRALGGIRPGDAEITDSYNLEKNGVKKIIHTVVHPWIDGVCGEETGLKMCYLHCLKIMKAERYKSIAFPFLGTGTCGYPNETAFRIAVDTVLQWLGHNGGKTVYLCIGNAGLQKLAEEYQKNHKVFFAEWNGPYPDFNSFVKANYDDNRDEIEQVKEIRLAYKDYEAGKRLDCRDFVTANKTDKDFSDQLQLFLLKYRKDKNKIAEKTKLSDSSIRKFINRERFPGRKQVLRIALAMGLCEEDFNDLLKSAGYGPGGDVVYLATLWHIRERIFDLDRVEEFLKTSYSETIFEDKKVRQPDYSDFNPHDKQ